MRRASNIASTVRHARRLTQKASLATGAPWSEDDIAKAQKRIKATDD
jgi:hypothetical protein